MELETLLLQGRALIDQTTDQHARRWGLGQADRWVLDQDTGRILWSFPDRVASADAQILGSWNAQVSSFVWSWDNDTVQAGMRATAEKVRAFGLEHDVLALHTSPLRIDEEQARDLVALACLLGECNGLYHPFDGRLAQYVAFGPVTLEEPGGQTSVFEAEVA